MDEQQSRTIVVSGSLDYVYDLWANFENFPKFMRHIKQVSKTGTTTSHWTMDGPLGRSIEWDAMTTTVERNRRIGWQSTGGDLETRGEVTFTDLGNHEVQVTFSQHYVAPGGGLGEAVASLIDDPDERLEDLLHDFKAYAEGEGRSKSRYAA